MYNFPRQKKTRILIISLFTVIITRIVIARKPW